MEHGGKSPDAVFYYCNEEGGKGELKGPSSKEEVNCRMYCMNNLYYRFTGRTGYI